MRIFYSTVCNRIFNFLLFFLLLSLECSRPVAHDERKIEIKSNRFHAVRFDPSYYYNEDRNVKGLSEELASLWSASGINAVYIKAYDPLHGAIYRTKHPLSIQTDYGRLDLFGALLDACHKQNIRVYAWIPAFLHKQAWEAHPEWRAVKFDGMDYRPTPDTYLLCVRRPEFREWWKAFVGELLKEYEDLDGIDIAEPLVSWKPDEGCFCEKCQEAYNAQRNRVEEKTTDLIRSEPLTSLLEETCRLIHDSGKSASITTVMTAHRDGRLFTPQEQRSMTGFDLDAILDSTDKPDIINTELIWQQMADVYADTSVFTPRWTENAVRQTKAQVANRSRLVIHPEITPIGSVEVTEEQFLKSVRSVLDARVHGIDFYDTHQADEKGMWPGIKEALNYVPVKRIAIYYDADGENDALQLDVLLRHFKTKTTLIPVGYSFSYPADPDFDVIFYIGVEYRRSLPANFIDFLFSSDKTICWINYNLQVVPRRILSELGIAFDTLDENSMYRIRYKNTVFPKADSVLNRVSILDSVKCLIEASAISEDHEAPYVLRSGNFWYVADLPSNFVAEGGRHIVLADLLHDILEEDHQEKHLALVRIEDVNPISDPQSLRAIANFLSSKEIPFSVGFTPFYLNPASNEAVALSDRPELVKALRHMVSRGGTMVLHGYTHQYRNESGIDYEFWDGMSDSPIFQDSEEYVRERIENALNECFRNGLYPLVWETPHYAASQLDYSVINRFFSTAYERRQTMDVSGTDQLLPFFIPGRDGHAQLIPENLGYVPMDDPSPERVIGYARNNLAVRDGFASFFFHPFVPLSALKEITNGIQELGYTFADIRTLNNRVTTPTQVIASGLGEIELNPQDQYFEEFYLTPKGKRKEYNKSKQKISQSIVRSVECPSGWMYIANTTIEQKPPFTSSLWSRIIQSPAKIQRLWESPKLKAADPPIIPVIITNPTSDDSISIDQSSFLRAFDAVGIDYQTIPVSDFLQIPDETNLVIIPHEAARELSEQQLLFLMKALSEGINLVLEKESEISARIGILPVGEEKRVRTIRDEYYNQVGILWKQEDRYLNFEMSEPTEYETFCSEAVSGDPIVIGAEYGEGKYLYFATLFDPTTGMGYGRYPFYLEMLKNHFDLWPLIKREQAEIYFEPGSREDVSIEDLVKMWKKHGFRKIYAAGWHVYHEWSYNYERLIELAHENAILVYLWLELPHVNERIWDDHPEWREITATGTDAMVDWRRNMALTDDDCRMAVFAELSDLIQKYDWDGINLAELYFESGLGIDRPDILTPFHPSARNLFREEYGFDPLLIFDENSEYFWQRNPETWPQFQKFRKDQVIRLHREFLTFLQKEVDKKGSDVEIVVTSLDNIIAKTTGENTATDTRRLIDLSREFSFILQIEDPLEMWHMGPQRYDSLSSAYHRLLPENPPILDINVVPYRDLERSLAPTQQPTGLEFYHFVKSALQKDNRVGIYSESSVYEVDLPWISASLGRHARENLSEPSWEIQSDQAIALNLDRKTSNNILVNDRHWPAYSRGRIILPSGTHTIKTIKKTSNLLNVFKTTTRLIDISGELKSCRLFSQGVDVAYDSPARNYIIVNDKPTKVLLDGELFDGNIFPGIPGYSLQLPPGSHEVKIFTRHGGLVSLKNVSIVTSVFIVAISSLAGTVLVTLYVSRFRKRRQLNNHKNSNS